MYPTYHMSWPAWLVAALVLVAIIVIVLRLSGLLFGGTTSPDVLIAGGYLPDPFYGTGWSSGQTILSADVYHPDSQSFGNAGNLGIGRVGQTATKLNTGTVLIIGGGDNTTTLYSARSFQQGPQMQLARRFHTATLLTDGTVLVAGGNFDGRAEIFDNTQGLFAFTGTMNFARSGHTATLLANGKVLLAGGVDLQSGAVTRSAELFDPEAQRFTLVLDAQGGTDALQQGRVFHTASLLSNNKVLIAGGLDRITPNAPEMAQSLLSGEIYDPDFLPDTAHGAFALVGNPPPQPGSQMAEGRVMHSQTSIGGGQAMIAGGTSLLNDAVVGDVVIGLKTADLYVGPDQDPWNAPTGSFLTIPGGLTSARGGHTATTLPDGTVLITGGVGGTVLEGDGALRDDAEIYDPNAGDPNLPVQPGAFRLIAPPTAGNPMPPQPHMQEARFGATATLLDILN